MREGTKVCFMCSDPEETILVYISWLDEELPLHEQCAKRLGE